MSLINILLKDHTYFGVILSRETEILCIRCQISCSLQNKGPIQQRIITKIKIIIVIPYKKYVTACRREGSILVSSYLSPNKYRQMKIGKHRKK